MKIRTSEWDAEAITATVGVGSIGMLVLSLAALDGLDIGFWGVAIAAILPPFILIIADPDFLSARAVRIAKWVGIFSYVVLALVSVGLAYRHGLAQEDGIFVGLVIWGALPCVDIAINLFSSKT